jgi:uncharacterized protein (TIRG00374 family)
MLKISAKHIKKYGPILISILLILVLVSYAPWSKVGNIFSRFHPITIIILVALSLIYYFLKSLRFWYLMEAIGINKPFPLVTLSYISAQPVSLLPAGEIYRSRQLQRYAGVPLKKSLPQFAIQGILEGAGMATLMIISALAIGKLRVAALALAVIVIFLTVAISRGYIVNAGHLLNHLPFLNINERSIKSFSERHKTVLTWHWMPFLYALSLLIEIAGSAIAYTAAVGLGAHINIYQAALFYIIPVIIGFISLLPGGIGLSEQGAVGVLLLSKVSVAQAVASTLIMRSTIVGLGVLYGCIALFIGRFTKHAEIGL